MVSRDILQMSKEWSRIRVSVSQWPVPLILRGRSPEPALSWVGENHKENDTMQNRYRILTTAIALAAFALAFAAGGAAGTSDADPIYNGSCGDGVDFSFDKGTHNIEYSGTGTGMMYKYKSKPGVDE